MESCCSSKGDDDDAEGVGRWKSGVANNADGDDEREGGSRIIFLKTCKLAHSRRPESIEHTYLDIGYRRRRHRRRRRRLLLRHHPDHFLDH
mmetsp:Transcript_45833/g.73716  ORF Transcript_45833/g.73716 Transcript_45833/m.73716 type:complete len:91 (+) Transcript_45833:879-1151(+)